jgi:hypothetical protein
MYAIQTIIIKKSVPLDEAVKKAKDISKKKKILMRELKQTYHFRNIPKTKFEKKTFRSKVINPEITLVFAKLKPEYSHLGQSKMEGDGIFSDLYNYGIKKFVPKVISAVVSANDFNNVSSNTLENYGSYTIQGMQIYRTPISNILNSAMNLISFGKWNELRKKYGYDKLFHTALVCDIGGKNIIVEKNEVVNISSSYKTSKETQTYHINMQGKVFTLNDMVQGCKSRMGDKQFFDYDAFTNNCQVFIKNMLQTVSLYDAGVDRFLFQDLSEIYKQLPSYTSKIAKLITRAGAFISRLRGDGDNMRGGIRDEKYDDEEKVDVGHNLRREEEKKEEPLVYRGKCTRGTPFGECFNKGFGVGTYLAYNPLMRQNKAKLLELCEKYDCPNVDENTTAKVMKEKLRLMGANVDLLDKILEQQEVELEQAIRADIAKRREDGEEEIDRSAYHKKKQRFNPSLGSLTVRDMVLLCRQYNCGSVNGKSYANMNRNELMEVLKNAGYKTRRV